MEEARPPFFSIGVTTYDRVGMLIETLRSILGQTFSDYEVIVSNDNPSRNISADSLGINDSRVRFVNQAKNLGERFNMNFLLNESKGNYFTWFADDDLYHPDFLKNVHGAIVKFDFPSCVFTSYAMGSMPAGNKNISLKAETLFTGQEFLKRYLSRTLKIQGCYGIFDVRHLKQIGGIGRLGDGFYSDYGNLPGNVFFPYADNLLIIRSGLLEKVAFIDAPLIFYRVHEGSVSLINTDLNAYRSAQEDLFCKCVNIFNTEGLKDDFNNNLFLLLKWFIGDFISVACRVGFINPKQMILWIIFITKSMRLLKKTGLCLKLFVFAIESVIKDTNCICRAKLKFFLK